MEFANCLAYSQFGIIPSYCKTPSNQPFDLSAELGFSVTGTSEHERNFNVTVSKNKKLNVKVYGNYKKYTFSVYKDGKYDASGKSYEPIGLTFKQYEYSK